MMDGELLRAGLGGETLPRLSTTGYYYEAPLSTTIFSDPSPRTCPRCCSHPPLSPTAAAVPPTRLGNSVRETLLHGAGSATQWQPGALGVQGGKGRGRGWLGGRVR